MTLQVLGAGLGRTGTFSLKHALERLGFEPCYHMFELMQHPAHLPVWHAALAGEPPDWAAALGAYAAAVDYPAAYFWRELLEWSPGARVILTIRDPQAWYESARETIYQPEPDLPGKLRLLLRLPFSSRLRGVVATGRYARRLVWKTHFDGRFDDRDHAIEVYERHNTAVRETVPAGQLLEFSVRDGWAPLCAFLGVAVPDEPFPHRNERAEFARLNNAFLR